MAILVAYDRSHPAGKAVEHAIDEYEDEEIVLLHVMEAAGGSLGAGFNLLKDELKEREQEREGEVIAELEDLLGEDLDYRLEIAVGKPAREIVQFAQEEDVDQVVVGSHGRAGVSRVLLGSVAEKVVRRSPVPVTVVR